MYQSQQSKKKNKIAMLYITGVLIGSLLDNSQRILSISIIPIEFCMVALVHILLPGFHNQGFKGLILQISVVL